MRALADGGIDWVLSGSAMLAVYGAALRPNDLDVVPCLEPDHLERLAGLLGTLDAVPAHVPDWGGGLTRAQCPSWRPGPATAVNLDHLFVTRLGMLDVPPTSTGTDADLRPEAVRVPINGTDMWVCDPREVLRRPHGRQRPKDRERSDAYLAVREHIARGGGPVGAPLGPCGGVSSPCR